MVADPKPIVSLEDMTASGTITGEAVGTDRYENLQSLRVEVDGETVLRRPEITGRRGEWPRRSKHVQFTKAVQSFDEPSTVRVVATDRRGQTTTVSREVMPTGQPEIVESEFVNLPVDSYHERLDPERYAAKHVVTVKLNGADPGNVSVSHDPSRPGLVRQLDSNGYELERRYTDDSLKIVSYWVGQVPDKYKIIVDLEHSGEISQTDRSTFVVQSSPPEIRLTAKTDGTTQSVDNWGLVLDASRSFDPDGTDLKYFWGEGAHPIGEGNSTGELRSVRFATLVVEDGSGAKATQNHSYHQFFVPSNATIQPVDDGPYLPNETVTFAVSTNKYKFSKNRYETQI
ncbi:MAG TPA: hypothetical protein VLA12_00040, partial [Planctomycetaceae bacterium]|nr:hypothetical protein [Planctomycetaceae bacterium]